MKSEIHTCFRKLIWLLIPALAIVGFSCQEKWDDYYAEPDYSSQDMIDIVRENPDYSVFIDYIEKFNLDTLFDKKQAYTLFIPNNAAFNDLSLTEDQILRAMGYHITTSVLLPSQIEEVKKILTLFGKFSFIERRGDALFRDGKEMEHNNPLYANGTFYTLDEILYPRPNLFEFLSDTCPVLSDYIITKDSVAFDPILSTPIGFDDDGNTIYDSIFNIVNTFERDYFPVSEEFRTSVATMVVCDQDQYNAALDIMAENLGGVFSDYKDIPLDWQNEVFIPYIFDYGMFIGSLEYEEFQFPLVKNIVGDSIEVDYRDISEESRYECSNGVVYLYNNFEVPLNLYIDTLILEAEELAEAAGSLFAWKEEVNSSDDLIDPMIVNSQEASGGKYLSIGLPRGSEEVYWVEFVFPKVFPNTYKFLWRANYRPSGNISVFFNDEEVGSFDNYYFRFPIDGNKPTSTGFNQKEWGNITIEEYGDLKIRFEYESKGAGTSNGINIDYVALFPEI